MLAIDHNAIIKLGLPLLLLAGLSACSVKDGPPSDFDTAWHQIEDAVPQPVEPSKYGNPPSYEVMGKRYYTVSSNDGFSQKGIASWYGSKFHGQRTSSGETYDMYAMTAAHKTLKIPTYVEVTNTSNNRKAIVRVNDRGPFHDGRIIDLSYAAATKLGVAATGTAPVVIRVVEPGEGGGVSDSVEQAISARRTTKPHEQEQASELNAAYTFDGGNVYVQIAAFATEENALKMLKELREKNFSSARIHVENTDGKLLYRVRIGPMPTTHVAEKVLAQLKEIDHDNAKIIKYN